MKPWISPVTRKRLRRFRRMRRAHLSLWLLAGLYGISLLANLLANDRPLYVRYRGRSYWPVFRFYPEDIFTGSGRLTRTDYKALARSEAFRAEPGNHIVFPPIPHGPNEIVAPESVELPDEVVAEFHRHRLTGTVDVDPEWAVVRSVNSARLLGADADADLRDRVLTDTIELPGVLRQAVRARFENREQPAVDGVSHGIELSLPPYAPRARPPRTVRITLREGEAAAGQPPLRVAFSRDLAPGWTTPPDWWEGQVANRVREAAARRFDGPVSPVDLEIGGQAYQCVLDREHVVYPFRPVSGHPFGLDSSGRDVLVQILYGLRVSMTFGLALVVVTMAVGILVGALQGYFGGAVDVIGQRLIVIWSALPFLYVMILLGSVYGRSFGLLLFCYAIFNWIGISYYIRAEFLKLRRQPFVEAAKVMGLHRRRIILHHILPNGLVPVITFFPFSLVGAIGSLAALDYLGFGLPPPTPSWGALLAQGQEFRHAWWLVLYPSVALFIVILLGVFIGEGVRAAFDPRHDSKLE